MKKDLHKFVWFTVVFFTYILYFQIIWMYLNTSIIIFDGFFVRWAIVYLAQLKPLIVPILNEAEWGVPPYLLTLFIIK